MRSYLQNGNVPLPPFLTSFASEYNAFCWLTAGSLNCTSLDSWESLLIAKQDIGGAGEIESRKQDGGRFSSLQVSQSADKSLCQPRDGVQLLRGQEIFYVEEALALSGQSREGKPNVKVEK